MGDLQLKWKLFKTSEMKNCLLRSPNNTLGLKCCISKYFSECAIKGWHFGCISEIHPKDRGNVPSAARLIVSGIDRIAYWDFAEWRQYFINTASESPSHLASQMRWALIYCFMENPLKRRDSRSSSRLLSLLWVWSELLSECWDAHKQSMLAAVRWWTAHGVFSGHCCDRSPRLI